MPISQTFRKDRRFWNESEIEEVELFFMIHPFFSKFYQREDFDKVVNFTFYTQLKENQQIRLQLNKKSQIIILLSGQITIYRKILKNQNKKKLKKKQNDILYEEYIKMRDYNDTYQAVQMKNDVIIKSKPSFTSEFLYVPSLLYQTHNYLVSNRKLGRTIEVLSNFFVDANKRDLKVLADSGCIFTQYKMNNYIYRAGQLPQNCFILVSGNVKIQSSGFSPRKMPELSIIGLNTIFGDRDLNNESRTHNAVCCSSHCRILSIKKEAYNKFIANNHYINLTYAEKTKPLMSPKIAKNSKSFVEKYEERHILPAIMRFHRRTKPQQEEEIEKQILQNCHCLISLSPQKRSVSSFRLPLNIERDYSVSQFDRKLSLFKRRKSSRPIDLSFKFF